MRRWLRQCRGRGLSLMVDLVADRLALRRPARPRDGAVARRTWSPRPAYRARGPKRRPDPCSTMKRSADASSTSSDLRHAAGERRRGRLPMPAPRPRAAEVWAEIGAAVRGEVPGCRFLAWTPGLAAQQVAALKGAGFDGVFSSAGLWDGRAGWPVDEYELLRSLGSVVAFPEAPLGTRLAQSLVTDELVERRVERALWMAATLADGVLVPMGLEFGAREAVPPTGAGRETYAALRDRPRLHLAERVRAVNAFVAREGGGSRGARCASSRAAEPQRRPCCAPTGATSVRPKPRGSCWSILPSTSAAGLSAGALSPEAGRFLPFRDVIGSGPNVEAEIVSTLGPAEVRVFEGSLPPAIVPALDTLRFTPESAVEAPRLVIEAVTPTVDGGRYPVKRIVGEVVRVEADAFAEGHDQIAVALKWRAADEDVWRERRMVAARQRPMGCRPASRTPGPHLLHRRDVARRVRHVPPRTVQETRSRPSRTAGAGGRPPPRGTDPGASPGRDRRAH